MARAEVGGGTKAFILRHGQTTFNVAGVKQGRSNDSVLTDLGRKQVQAVGEKLKAANIVQIFSSPIERARQTALIIQQYTGAPIKIDERLTEYDCGVVAGWTKARIAAEFPNAKPVYDTPRWPGAETLAEIDERVTSFLVEMCRDRFAGNVVIATHGAGVAAATKFFGKEVVEGTVPNGYVICADLQSRSWTEFLGGVAVGGGLEG